MILEQAGRPTHPGPTEEDEHGAEAMTPLLKRLEEIAQHSRTDGSLAFASETIGLCRALRVAVEALEYGNDRGILKDGTALTKIAKILEAK